MVTLMLQMAENIKNDKTELEEFQEILYHHFYMNLIQSKNLIISRSKYLFSEKILN